jgi:hypothetical protein
MNFQFLIRYTRLAVETAPLGALRAGRPAEGPNGATSVAGGMAMQTEFNV